MGNKGLTFFIQNKHFEIRPLYSIHYQFIIFIAEKLQWFDNLFIRCNDLGCFQFLAISDEITVKNFIHRKYKSL